MNKYEKEVAAKLLKNETKAISNLKKAFSEALADVKKKIKYIEQSISNGNTNAIYQLQYQQLIEQQINANLDILNSKNVKTVSDFLEKSYKDSYFGDFYNLQMKYNIDIYNPVSPLVMFKSVTKPTNGYNFSQRLYDDIDKLKKVVKSEISRGIAQGNGYARIAKNISGKFETSYSNAYRIARTEGGRVSTEAQLETINYLNEQGIEIEKRWDATLDSRTREVHSHLDGQTVEVSQPFKSDIGFVDAPHKFGIASQDINCRCRLVLIPKNSKMSTRNSKIDFKNDIISYKTFNEWEEGMNDYYKSKL